MQWFIARVSGRMLPVWRLLLCALLLFIPLAAFGDRWEPDDSAAAARRLLVNDLLMIVEQHDFHVAGDEDWILFYVRGDYRYSVRATSVSLTCDVTLTLFESDGVTTVEPYGEVDDGGPGEGEAILMPNLRPGFYFARFRSAVPHAAGSDVSYWIDLRANVGAGLPIETVDERTIGIRKETSVAGGGARAAPAVLTPGPASTYTKHCIEFPGYVQTETGTALDVTIRQVSTEREKFGLPGPSFPWSSEAIFVIETVRWSGGTSMPVAFTDPVNITVEFAPYSSQNQPEWDDIVTLDAQPATPDCLRIVRDMIDGEGVRFEIIGGMVNTAERIVVISDFVGLTGPSGCATYGVAAPTSLAAVRRWCLYR